MTWFWGISRFNYKDLTYEDLTRRTVFDKILRDKAFEIQGKTGVKYTKYDEYQCGIASMAYKFFDKKTSSGSIKN